MSGSFSWQTKAALRRLPPDRVRNRPGKRPAGSAPHGTSNDSAGRAPHGTQQPTAKMPYARSAPTADAAHYEQDRALQWQREKQIRKDAARRRKLRAQSNEKRQAAETERAQNEYAERKHKKLEYVKYLRSQLQRRQRPKRTPREPTQYEVEERRKEASKRRAVQAREREAARRTDALAAATAAARALARKNARRAQDAEVDSVARTAPPMGACPTTRSSCGDLAAPGLDGATTQPPLGGTFNRTQLQSTVRAAHGKELWYDR